MAIKKVTKLMGEDERLMRRKGTIKGASRLSDVSPRSFRWKIQIIDRETTSGK